MGKLKVFPGKDICKLLADHGFQIVRQKGSHIVLQKKVDDSTVTVPVPDHKEIAIGTLKSIIRQSKLPSTLFEN